jgi:3-methyladenine DNA glycosylase AlkD
MGGAQRKSEQGVLYKLNFNMMKPEELFKEILAFCRSNYNEAIVKKYSRYFKEGVFDSWGLTREIIQSGVKEILERKDVDFQLLRETSKMLVVSPKYEGTSFAINFYRSGFENFSRETFDDITAWFETGITNWGHCDVISGDLIFKLLDKKIISYKDLKPWLSAKNKFQRRAVAVSLIKLLKESQDFKPYFSFIEPLMSDPEREVHQGVGWFLREAWKLQRDETEEFLLKWKNTSPRLIFQYACERMSPENKLQFKRNK